MTATPHRPLLGIMLMIIGISLLSGLDVFVKTLTQDYTIAQTIFLRSLLALPVILMFVPFEGGIRALRTQRPMLHASRGVVMIATAVCFFYSFQQLPLADAYALIFASPLIVTVLAIPLLGEKVGRHRVTAVLIGFAGVLIAMRPGFGTLELATYVALLGAVLYSFVQIFIRQMSRTESSIAITFYGTVMICALAAATMPWYWQPPTADAWLMFMATGLLGGVGQYCLTTAFRFANASILAPYQYLSLIWGVIFGYVLFHDVPGIHTIIGSFVIAGSGLYIIHRERQKKRQMVTASVSPPVSPPVAAPVPPDPSSPRDKPV